MSGIEVNTGSPPAVMSEQLERWREIAAAVESALSMGGEPGMDLLVSRVAEWNEAVNEWTAGLQTCLELGVRGLRDEALQWHAEGFLEAGDLLRSPTERAGWGEWQEVLEQREMPLPRFDSELRDLVGKLSVELQSPDISKRSLRSRIDGLRRNAIVRGDLSERLTLLESICKLDGAREAWIGMIAPIRRQRAEQIESELRTALAKRDFVQLAKRVEEVRNVNWDGHLPGTVAEFVNVISHLITSKDAVHALDEAASRLRVRTRELEEQPLNLPSFSTYLRNALLARGEYLRIRQELSQSLQHAASKPETKAVAVALKLGEPRRQIDASLKPVLARLAQQEQFEGVRLQFCGQEDEIQKLIAMAPASGGGWEAFKDKAARWLDLEAKLRIATNRLCSNMPDLVPPSTASRLADLETCREAVKAARERVVVNEKIAIGGIIGGLLFILLMFIAILAFSAAGGTR
jgi:hypothetical protein